MDGVTHGCCCRIVHFFAPSLSLSLSIYLRRNFCLCRQSSETSFAANRKKSGIRGRKQQQYCTADDEVLLHTRGRFGPSATRFESLVWRVIRLVRPPRGGWSTQQVRPPLVRLHVAGLVDILERGEHNKRRLCKRAVVLDSSMWASVVAAS